MDKLLEALSKLVPDNDMKEISASVKEMLEDARNEIKTELEKEFNSELETAYVELSEQLAEAEKIGVEGYQEALAIILDLRNRMEAMRVEYDAALDEGYEEALQTLKVEQGKNETLEADLHEAYEKKVKETTDFIIEMVNKFLCEKGAEIYEQARRDIMNDPSMVEHKIVLEKIVEQVSDYISDEDLVNATSSKFEAVNKALKEANDRVRMLESKNIRITTENNKLQEQVKQAAEVITESKQTALNENKKARVEKAKNVEGRGKVTTEKVEVVSEYAANDTKSDKEDVDTSLVEQFNEADLHYMQVMAGTKKND